MKIKDITGYWCDHCNKFYRIQNACLRHEKACHRNPENSRACQTCSHLEKVNTMAIIDYPDGEVRMPVSVFHCPKLDKFLHFPKTEHKGNAWELIGSENEPMPKECEKWQDCPKISDGPWMG